MSIPIIGDARDRVDGRAKVTGRARYAAEYNVDDLVHAVVVPSTIASGRIKSIDTTAALKAPGVLTVITYLNAPKLNQAPPQCGAPQPNSGNFAEPKLIPFSGPDIHYLGQQIAVVVAHTLEEATHAASLIRITYDETPPRR